MSFSLDNHWLYGGKSYSKVETNGLGTDHRLLFLVGGNANRSSDHVARRLDTPETRQNVPPGSGLLPGWTIA